MSESQEKKVENDRFWIFTFDEETGDVNIQFPKHDQYTYEELLFVLRGLARFVAMIEKNLDMLEKLTNKQLVKDAEKKKADSAKAPSDIPES